MLSVVEASVKPERLDEILKDYRGPEDCNTIFKGLKKALVERALGAELTHPLGYAPGEAKPEGQTDHRNGVTGKTVLTEDGEWPLQVPRDREGSVEPPLVKQGERRCTRLRREDHRAVCAGNDRTSDPRLPAGAL